MWIRPQRTVLAVDIGGTWARFGLVESQRGVVIYEKVDSRAFDQDNILDLLEAFIMDRFLSRQRELSPSEVVIGVPATIDRARGIVLSSPNLRALNRKPIGPVLSERLHLPVTVERDVNLALLGELRAGGYGSLQHVVGVFVGTGIGCAAIQNGVLVTGAHGGAGELGHIPYCHEPDAPVCSCGLRGCVELYASGTYLERALTELGLVHKIDETFEPGADATLQQIGMGLVDALSVALAIVINLVDPELVILGGGVLAMRGFPLARLETEVRARLRRPVLAETVRFAPAKGGDTAALLGALALSEGESTGRSDSW